MQNYKLKNLFHNIKIWWTPSRGKMQYFWWWFPWVSIWDMNNQKIITETKETLSQLGIENSNVKLIKKWSLLFSFKLSVWKVAFAGTDLYTNEAIASFDDSNPEVDLHYLYYCLPIYALKNSRTNNYGAPLLNKNILENLEIPLPPLATQRAIADKLDKLQSLIDLKKQAIIKTDELTKSIFLEMFGDTVTNEKNWKVKTLGDLCDVGSSKRVFVDELVEKWVPFYRGTEIWKLSDNDHIEPTLFITQDHYEKLKEQTGIPKIGDLLMPSICPDGRIFRVTDDKSFYFKDGRVLWIKVNESKVNSIYLKALLKEIFYADYSNIASGTTFAELKIFALKKIKILFPPLSLQQKFADIITQIESQKSEHKLALAKLEELYQAEMQRSFSL